MADGNAISTDSKGRKRTEKDPDSQLDYPFDWGDWLADVGDAYASHQILITDPAGATTPLTVVSSGYLGGKITAFINGGTLKKTHIVTCRITTTGGGGTPRKEDQSLYIKIVPK